MVAVEEDLDLENPMREDDPIIIRMRNVHKTYLLGVEGVPALRGVDMTIKRGEFVVILGKSGSGKSTMMNIIGTVDKPTRGDVYICGNRVSSSAADATLAQFRLQHIGFVFQTFNLIDTMTAQENVELPMVLTNSLSARDRSRRSIQLLKKVGMGTRLSHHPTELSGGEQQRVTIARALSNDPDILLLDEPTGDLDSVNSAMVMKILCDLHRNEGATIVMVTHDIALKEYADRVLSMFDGKIVKEEIIDESLKTKRRNSAVAHNVGVDDQQLYEVGDLDNDEDSTSERGGLLSSVCHCIAPRSFQNDHHKGTVRCEESITTKKPISLARLSLEECKHTVVRKSSKYENNVLK